MKKFKIDPEDLLNDYNKIIKNIELLEDNKISLEKLNKIKIKFNKDKKSLDNKYKDI